MAIPDLHRSTVGQWTLPLIAAAVAGLLALAAGVDSRWHERLDYLRPAIATGEAWRLVTAHLIHLSARHAVLDIGGLLMVTWIFGSGLGPARQAVAGLVGIVSVDVGLWFFHPEVERYVGLSGMLHAWFAAGATGWLLAGDERNGVAGRLWGLVLLAGVVAKLMLESRVGALWLDDASMTVVTAAHRWGAAGGLAVAVVFAGLGSYRARAAVASRGR